jgi:hypothetical protein
MKEVNMDYLAIAKKISAEERVYILSRMGGKLPKRLQKEKLTVEEAIAIQLELESEQLQEWRANMAALEEKALKAKIKATEKADKAKLKAEEKADKAKLEAVKASTKDEAVKSTSAKPATVKPAPAKPLSTKLAAAKKPTPITKAAASPKPAPAAKVIAKK